VSDVRYLYDLKVTMRDGVRLSADVVLPRGTGPFPTILFRTPYESAAERFIQWGIWWAQRGYATVSQDCRGKYESEGTFYAYLSDGPDTVDTLEWVANQPWCNGKIGAWGRSYGGLYQWLAGPLGSPHRTTMVPHVISDDYFRDYHYVGGAFQLTLSLSAAIILTSNLAIAQGPGAALFNNRRFMRQLPLIDMDVEAIGRKIPFWRDWLEHDRYDEYWQAISTVDKYDKITVPIFQQCGWYDAYPGSTMRHWQGMTERGGSDVARMHQKVLMGPWSHQPPESSIMGELDFGPAAYVRMEEVEKRWFDYWLKGEDDGFISEPPINLFVMGTNAWRHEQEWPLARTQYTPYYLHSSGRANSLFGDGTLSPEPPAGEPADRFDYDPDNPVPSVGGNNSTGMWTQKAEEPIIPGPVDQRAIERRDDVLVYTTPPLERDLELTGPLEMVLYAASSARDTDFTVRLVDVFPNGYAMNLSEGIVRARYRNDDADPELLERGEPQRYAIRMYPTSNVFKAGHRIRVDISSSSFPRFSRNLNTGENVATGTRLEVANQTILHASEYPSHIVLPVIPGPA
jgi:putative CocE/NonD family hydrolase